MRRVSPRSARSFVNNAPFVARAGRARARTRWRPTGRSSDQDCYGAAAGRAGAARARAPHSRARASSPTRPTRARSPNSESAGTPLGTIGTIGFVWSIGAVLALGLGVARHARNRREFVAQLGVMQRDRDPHRHDRRFRVPARARAASVSTERGTASRCSSRSSSLLATGVLARPAVRVRPEAPSRTRQDRVGIVRRSSSCSVARRRARPDHAALRPGLHSDSRRASTSTRPSTTTSKVGAEGLDDVPAPVPAVPRSGRDREHGRLPGLHRLPAHEEPALELRRA